MTSRPRTSGLHQVGRTLAAAAAVCLAAAVQAQVSPQLLQGMQWRNIGPFIAGKVDSVSGVSGQPAIGYVGTDNGGVWKTVNAGVTWHPVTDAVHTIRGITALAVAPSHASIIYAGTGSIFGSQRIDQGQSEYLRFRARDRWAAVSASCGHRPDLLAQDFLHQMRSRLKRPGPFAT